MSLIKSKIDVIKLAEKIRSGNFPTQKIKLDQFFTKTFDGQWVPDPDKRIQVREKTRDIGFVTRIINKIQTSGDNRALEPLTCVRMPNGELLIVNGSHTSEISIKTGQTEDDAYIVDWKKDLGGRMSLAKRLGNLLNKQWVEKVSVHDNDVKNELYQLMAEKKADNLDPKPTEQEIQEFLSCYPSISRRTLGQWISNTDVGGRKKPLVEYTDSELADHAKHYTSQQKYVDYVICNPQTVAHWNDTGTATPITLMANQGKTKALVVFYCSTIEQAESWKSGALEKKIKRHYTKLNNHYEVTIEYDMLRYE